MSNRTPAPAKRGRIAQIREAYRMTKTVQPRIGLVLLGWFWPEGDPRTPPTGRPVREAAPPLRAEPLSEARP